MDSVKNCLEIVGSNRLLGTVKASGSKNSALAILCASLLNGSRVTLLNVPDITDIKNLLEAMQKCLGIQYERDGNRLSVDSSLLTNTKTIYLPNAYTNQLRASIYLLGVLSALGKEVVMGTPGGDKLGNRPINYHIRGLNSLGINLSSKDGYLSNGKPTPLKNAKINLPFPSIGTTMHLMMAASLTKGITQISNSARDPEIVDLAYFLRKIGVEVKGEGTNTITLFNKGKLRSSTFSIMPDHSEVVTFIVAAIITNGQIEIYDCNPNHCMSLLQIFIDSGANISYSSNSIKIQPNPNMRAFKILFGAHPLPPSDWQPMTTTLACFVDGQSEIADTYFDNRSAHIAPLLQFGAKISIDEKVFHIRGPVKFKGKNVYGEDIRSCAALFLAGLAAQGVTKLHGIEHLFRGYERIDKKFSKLGADIKLAS